MKANLLTLLALRSSLQGKPVSGSPRVLAAPVTSFAASAIDLSRTGFSIFRPRAFCRRKAPSYNSAKKLDKARGCGYDGENQKGEEVHLSGKEYL
jgi:hypothetical protein